jgi:hypothetical protein
LILRFRAKSCQADDAILSHKQPSEGMLGGGGIEEKLGALKPERGGGGEALKNTEIRKKGGFEKIYQFEKTVVLKMYHKTT